MDANPTATGPTSISARSTPWRRASPGREVRGRHRSRARTWRNRRQSRRSTRRSSTASVGWTQPGGRLAWLAAFGQKREIHGNLEAYLFEATLHVTAADIVYTRVESVAKDILDIGFHPGVFHRHRQSQVGAVTVGYVRDAWRGRGGSFGIGADVTGHVVPANLEESYGSPVSFHAFVRYRLPPRGGSPLTRALTTKVTASA